MISLILTIVGIVIILFAFALPQSPASAGRDRRDGQRFALLIVGLAVTLYFGTRFGHGG